MKLIKVVVACGHMDDAPGLMPVIVECTRKSYVHGFHYEKAKNHARSLNYDGPFVAIDESDSPGLMDMFDWKKAQKVKV